MIHFLDRVIDPNDKLVDAGLSHPEYTRDAWTTRQPGAKKAAWARQDWSWIQQECRDRGLVAVQQTSRDLRYWDQTWLKITRIQAD